ncbi:hypothetical protein HD554DRAFT_725493 [Boletus coccyginus]|nr:hypothetical protein HD554DRAFT_725493 [Boletus coccyginus]
MSQWSIQTISSFLPHYAILSQINARRRVLLPFQSLVNPISVFVTILLVMGFTELRAATDHFLSLYLWGRMRKRRMPISPGLVTYLLHALITLARSFG